MNQSNKKKVVIDMGMGGNFNVNVGGNYQNAQKNPYRGGNESFGTSNSRYTNNQSQPVQKFNYNQRQGPPVKKRVKVNFESNPYHKQNNTNFNPPTPNRSQNRKVPQNYQQKPPQQFQQRVNINTNTKNYQAPNYQQRSGYQQNSLPQPRKVLSKDIDFSSSRTSNQNVTSQQQNYRSIKQERYAPRQRVQPTVNMNMNMNINQYPSSVQSVTQNRGYEQKTTTTGNMNINMNIIGGGNQKQPIVNMKIDKLQVFPQQVQQLSHEVLNVHSKPVRNFGYDINVESNVNRGQQQQGYRGGYKQPARRGFDARSVLMEKKKKFSQFKLGMGNVSPQKTNQSSYQQNQMSKTLNNPVYQQNQPSLSYQKRRSFDNTQNRESFLMNQPIGGSMRNPVIQQRKKIEMGGGNQTQAQNLQQNPYGMDQNTKKTALYGGRVGITQNQQKSMPPLSSLFRGGGFASNRYGVNQNQQKSMPRVGVNPQQNRFGMNQNQQKSMPPLSSLLRGGGGVNSQQNRVGMNQNQQNSMPRTGVNPQQNRFGMNQNQQKNLPPLSSLLHGGGVNPQQNRYKTNQNQLENMQPMQSHVRGGGYSSQQIQKDFAIKQDEQQRVDGFQDPIFQKPKKKDHVGLRLSSITRVIRKIFFHRRPKRLKKRKRRQKKFNEKDIKKATKDQKFQKPVTGGEYVRLDIKPSSFDKQGPRSFENQQPPQQYNQQQTSRKISMEETPMEPRQMNQMENQMTNQQQYSPKNRIQMGEQEDSSFKRIDRQQTQRQRQKIDKNTGLPMNYNPNNFGPRSPEFRKNNPSVDFWDSTFNQQNQGK